MRGGKQTIAAITAGADCNHDICRPRRLHVAPACSLLSRFLVRGGAPRLRPQHIQGGIGHGSGGELHHLVVGHLMGQECFFRSADLISRISEHKPSLTTPA